MPDPDASLLAPVLVAAALVIRTAVVEMRQPGSARRTWAFAGSPRAVAAGATVTAAVLLTGAGRTGWTAAAWALLAGAFTAHLTGRDLRTSAPEPAAGSGPPMTPRRIGALAAAVCTPLAVAGAALHTFPGPGLPALAVGLALLLTGLLLAAAGRR
ncbi:hypothetical protein SUDANB120_00144 [Streptomyces sp. enrichment culture]|uniref:hypothetical protein n=1 Tax=Streptomyces TaxID=1883 RepID=UPI0019C1A169|nr:MULTISPECIES: hypothetical protein [Streptomyces]GGT03125.1 hypothetical protein GCM10010286_30430 [Streptomyces toxytricini]